jgi:hypothetical protein
MRHALAPETSRPSEKDLRRFFEENRARFERPSTISLVQVLFANGRPVPGGLIERLNAGADPAEIGDFDMGLGSTIRRASADNLAGLFGREATSSILAIADDRWHGPFHSARGLHFVRISERYPPEGQTFEQVATYVEEDWELARQSEAVARALKVLGREYVVVRPASDKR